MAGEQELRSLQQPLGDHMEKSKDPTFRTFITSHSSLWRQWPQPGPPWAASSKRLCEWPPAESARSRTFPRSICCTPGMVLGFLGNVLSCLEGTCDIFWGAHFGQELGNMSFQIPVVSVSLLPPSTGCAEVQKKRFGDSFGPNDPLRIFLKAGAKGRVSFLPSAFEPHLLIPLSL